MAAIPYSTIESVPTELLVIDKLSSIALAKLLAAGLAHLPDHNVDDIAEWIIEIAGAFENIDLDKLSVIINEERVVSGFPKVPDFSAIEAEIQGRRRHYRHVAKSALNNFSQKELVEVVTLIVKSEADDDKGYVSILIADLVDSYEVEVQGFFGREEDNIKNIVKKPRAVVDAKQPDSTLIPMMSQLIQVMNHQTTN